MTIDHLLQLLMTICRWPPVRWLANHCCRNRERVPKKAAQAAVTTAVSEYYREKRLEAAFDARQARVYQKIHFRQAVKALAKRSVAAPGREEPQAGSGPAALESYRRRLRELGQCREPEEIISYLSSYYIDDMAAAFDPAFFIAFRSLARRLFPRLVGSIRMEVEPGVLPRLRELMGRETLLLVPNHVSNADHIPLCFAINSFGGLQPVIAAGANLFRGRSAAIMPRLNAYKIRREQIGADSRWFYQVKWFHNPVYRRVHSEYLHFLWDKREPFMFYIEGTRSRDGSLGEAKMGIMEDLAKYVQRRNRRVFLVPVSLSYTVVPEDLEIEASRQGENISNRDLVTQLLRLDREYRLYRRTDIHLRFGRPLAYGPEDGEIRKTVDRLLAAIARGIVPPVTSILAALLLRNVSREKAFTVADLQQAWERERARGGKENFPFDPGKDLLPALDILVRKDFVAYDHLGQDYRVVNWPLVRQYARRIAHLW